MLFNLELFFAKKCYLLLIVIVNGIMGKKRSKSTRSYRLANDCEINKRKQINIFMATL